MRTEHTTITIVEGSAISEQTQDDISRPVKRFCDTEYMFSSYDLFASVYKSEYRFYDGVEGT